MDQVQVKVGIENPSDVVTGAVDVKEAEAPELEQASAAEMQELPVEDVGALGPEQADTAEVQELPVEDAGALGPEQADTAEVQELPVEDVGALGPEQADTAEVQELPVKDVGALEPEQAGSAEMRELPVEDWDYQRPRRGQIRTGVVLAIEEQEIIVDVGAKRDGIVPYADIQRMGLCVGICGQLPPPINTQPKTPPGALASGGVLILLALSFLCTVDTPLGMGQDGQACWVNWLTTHFTHPIVTPVRP
ncbi:hypothetical protein ACFLYD_07155 [Chloroflexota bacterium]